MAYGRKKVLYSTWEPEKILYESVGLTREQYIINEFEEKTGMKFDPLRHEIAFEKVEKDTENNNTMVPINVIEKSKSASSLATKTTRGRKKVEEEVDSKEELESEEDDENEESNEEEPELDLEVEEEEEIDSKEEQEVKIEPEEDDKNEESDEEEPELDIEVEEEQELNIDDEESELDIDPGEIEEVELEEDEDFEEEPEVDDSELDIEVEEETVSKDLDIENNEEKEIELEEEKTDSEELEESKFDLEPKEEKELDTEDDEKKRLIQDMIDKYYGNSEKEKEYKTRYKRFKSHIINKEFKYLKDGEVLTGTCKSIDKAYPEYEEDIKFLQFDEYGIRLERLTRAELGDFSLYEIIVNEYLHYNAGEEKSEEVFKQLVEMLRQEDAEYIETNNYAYNSNRATCKDLKSLGKYGQRVSYIPLDGDVLGNVVKILANIGIISRNYTTSKVHRDIGSFTIRPVRDLIIDAEKGQGGIYSGHLLHRYLARKVYFESKLENESKKINGFIPCFKAIINYKEGNELVINTGKNDIATSFDRIESEKRKFESKVSGIKLEIDALLRELNEEKLVKLLELKDKLNSFIYTQYDIIKTDTIVLSLHDNQETMTKVVTGFRVTDSKFVGPKIKSVIEQAKDTEVLNWRSGVLQSLNNKSEDYESSIESARDEVIEEEEEDERE